MPQSALRNLDQMYMMGIGQGPAPARVPRTRGQTTADMLGAAAIGTTPIPIVGDIVGAAADVAMFASDPTTRTLPNYAMSALGALPLVPGVAAVRAARGANALEGTLDMPQAARMQTEYELAHEVAQRNAALPVEQGGLGLPPNNTAMDRANAPGMFPDDAYHFSRHGADVQELDSGKYAIAPFDAVGTHVGSKEQVLDRFENTVGYKVNNPMYANDELKGVTYPLRVNTGNRMLSPSGLVMSETPISMGFSASADYGNLKTSNEALRESIFPKYDSIPYINEVESPGQISYILPPKNIRSRFAAFDPAKRGSSNLMAGAAGATIGLSALRNIQREEEPQPD
jgi:hypothetical protein